MIARRFARSPALTAAALFAVALGIGANTAILSVVDGLRHPPLPFDDASSLVRVWMEGEGPEGVTRSGLTAADLRDLRAEPALFAALAGWRAADPTYVGLSDERPLQAAEITADLFPGVLRVQPFLGRTFLPEEDEPGSVPTAVLSHRFWGDELGADPDVIGRSLVLDGVSFVVVGVMPPGFRTPFVPGAVLWTPARLDVKRCRTECPTLSAVGRLAGGTTLPVARDRATVVGRRLAESYPGTNRGVAPELGPLRDPASGLSEGTVQLLMAAGVFVLLITALNVALLLLARGLDRVREMRIRRAVGASRAQLVRQLMGETLALTMVGSLVGVGVGVWSVEALVATAPNGLFPDQAPGLDGGIVLAVAALTVVTGLLAGVVPALVGSDLRTATLTARALGPGGRTRSGDGRGLYTARRRIWPPTLNGVAGVLQLSLTTVLLVGAGGLLRSLHSATHDSLGFDAAGVLTMEADLTAGGHRTPSERLDRLNTLLERLEEVPGVFSVAAAGSLPFDEADDPVRIRIEDGVPEASGPPRGARVRPVSSAYFYTLGQRLVEGRGFRADDDATSESVAIVNQSAARKLLSDLPGSPVGARVAVGDGRPLWRTVVGVVRDDWEDSELRPAEPVLYLPLAQSAPAAVALLARVDSEPASMVTGIREALAELEPTLRAATVEPLEHRVDEAYAGERFGVTLSGAFATLSLLLSVVGLFGILTHTVVSSLGELGLRRVLGATDEQLRRRVVLRGAAIAGVGVLLGGLGAALFARGLDAVFAAGGTRSPFVYAMAVTVIGVAAVAASAWPARRSVAEDALSALRAD